MLCGNALTRGISLDPICRPQFTLGWQCVVLWQAFFYSDPRISLRVDTSLRVIFYSDPRISLKVCVVFALRVVFCSDPRISLWASTALRDAFGSVSRVSPLDCAVFTLWVIFYSDPRMPRRGGHTPLGVFYSAPPK